MKLVKISSDRIQIKTDQKEFEHVRINDLLSVSDGAETLITMVAALTDTDAESGMDEEEYIVELPGIKIIDCSIIGSLKDGTFYKSISRYPVTDVAIEQVSNADFLKMLRRYFGFHIGKYVEYDCPAYVDGNKFFQRHSCILGNTGSGKSETAAKILQEAGRLKNTNIIVFDIHGEYSRLSYVKNLKIGQDFPFPIWMFSFSDIVANILKIKEESATVAMTALRKCYYKLNPEGSENRPSYFSYEKFLSELDALNRMEIATGEFYKTGEKAGLPKTVKGDYNGKLTNIVNSLRDKKKDSRYRFLFEEQPPEYLYDVAQQILSNHEKPVKNIDLSAIPHDVAIMVIGTITRLVYDFQRSNKGAVPLVLFCDEAHVYMPNNFQLSASEQRMAEVFEDIAKEGRKFGTTLLTASQRPSELNKTVIAQCANFIVSKLNNENDKSMIKAMLPDGNDKIIDSVTMFNPGEVLIIGDAVPIPLKIQVSLAAERPESRTIDFWDVWSMEEGQEVNELLKEYFKTL